MQQVHQQGEELHCTAGEERVSSDRWSAVESAPHLPSVTASGIHSTRKGPAGRKYTLEHGTAPPTNNHLPTASSIYWMFLPSCVSARISSSLPGETAVTLSEISDDARLPPPEYPAPSPMLSVLLDGMALHHTEEMSPQDPQVFKLEGGRKS